jgi:hypothetical protein
MTAKMTLLEMVQSILSSTDSDDVDSISDTVEATQVAYIIRDVFNLMVANRTVPEHYQLGVLTSPSSTSYPNYFQYPAASKTIEFVKYDIIGSGETASKYVTIEYLDPYEFVNMCNSRNEDASNITEVTDYGGAGLLIQTDKAPQFYTSFDDNYLVFDSYDSAVDTDYLQASKTQCYYSTIPVFTISDSFTPDIDDNMFPLLLAESKSTAFIELKQQQHGKAEQAARRQNTRIQKERAKTRKANGYKGPDYGRK